MLASLGFCSVLAASLVVMVCSLLGIPTSTTHCQVGCDNTVAWTDPLHQVMAVMGAGVGRGAIQGGGFQVDTIIANLV